MIGKLSGRIDEIAQDHLILDVQGVGYVVQASGRTLQQMGAKGEALSLMIETHVREDAITLFGFAQASERHWFKLLYSVQGVGPKAALAILSVCPPEELSLAIAAQDKAILTRAEGVGPKLATRILTELKDKAGKMDQSQPAAVKITGAANPLDQDAVSALVNLGYGRSEAYAAVARVKDQANDISDILRLALKELSA